MRDCVGQGDYVKFTFEGQQRHGFIFGSADSMMVGIILLQRVTFDVFNTYSLSPINASKHPMAYTSKMIELISTGVEVNVSRNIIDDIIFVLPLQEVESGNLFMAGSDFIYFQRYGLSNNTLILCPSSVYYSRYIVEPFSIRIFQSLNTFSDAHQAVHVSWSKVKNEIKNISFAIFY
jgi:hypothetical protein